MLFKTITKEDFRHFVEMLLQSQEVIGPKQVAVNKKGKPVYHFLPVKSFNEIAMGYDTSELSAKTYFLPYRETLSTYKFEGDDWQQEINYRLHPRVILGMHACDINALLKMDKVFSRNLFPSPYYLARRKNTFIIGMDHEPCEGGFCQSMGADAVTHGFDLFLTDLGSRYFVAINSDRAFGLLNKVPTAAPTDKDTQDYLDVRNKISAAYKTHINAKNLPNLLDIEFESPVWKKWGEKCLSCGNCAMVCPTCYCYGVSEEISMSLNEGQKVKNLHSCNLVDFALVAGGHNFRPSREQRLKYRYYHQHRGFVEAYDEPKCVGCNRCGRTCPTGISPSEVIHDLQVEEKK